MVTTWTVSITDGSDGDNSVYWLSKVGLCSGKITDGWTHQFNLFHFTVGVNRILPMGFILNSGKGLVKLVGIKLLKVKWHIWILPKRFYKSSHYINGVKGIDHDELCLSLRSISSWISTGVKSWKPPRKYPVYSQSNNSCLVKDRAKISLESGEGFMWLNYHGL